MTSIKAALWLATISLTMSTIGLLADDAVDSPPDAEQIQRWVDALQSERYQDREAATSRLIQAGRGAVAPIVAALKRNDLEVTTRGIQVLQALAQQADWQTAEAAREALESTAALRVTSAARLATEVLEKLAVVRHEQTLETLKQLGATVSNRPSPTSTFVPISSDENFVVIEIGEQWQGQPEDLKRLGWLLDVGEVILEGKQVDDQWLENLPDNDHLTNFTIKRAAVSDGAMKYLKRLKGLETLNLIYTPVGDASAEQLRRLPNLTKLRLFGTKFSPDGVAQLRATSPRLDIDVRRGAFLGIGCHAGQIGCLISTVTIGSAADKAGLQVNDVVVKYEGKPVADFETLTAMIAENVGGDTVTMELQRGAQQLTKEVTLGSWE